MIAINVVQIFQLKEKKTVIAINRFNKKNARFMVNKKGVLMVIRDLFGKNKSNVFIFKVIIKKLLCIDKNPNA